jgi:PAS domain-containing protein
VVVVSDRTGSDSSGGSTREPTSEPIYTLDRGLRFTLVNEAVADLFGRDQETLPGEHVAASGRPTPSAGRRGHEAERTRGN